MTALDAIALALLFVGPFVVVVLALIACREGLRNEVEE